MGLTADDLGSIPYFGDGYKLGKDAAEGNLAATANDLSGAVDTVKGFLDEAAGKSVWLDPLSVLANSGLGFLLDHCGVLKSAMELVTGDSATVTKAADTWGDISKELQELAKSTTAELGSGLADWGGKGAQAAGKQLAELVTAIEQIGTEANNLSQLLQASAALMDAALDIVKSIISDLVSWLIMTWVAAHASAVFTLGSSEAVALEASVVEIEITSVRVAGKVAEVERVLVRIEQVVVRIERTISLEVKNISKFASFKRAVGGGIGGKLKEATGSALQDGAKSLGASLLDQILQNGGSDPRVSKADIDRGLSVGD